MKKMIALMGVVALVATGCGSTAVEEETISINTDVVATSFVADEQFTNNDFEVGCILGDYETISLANNSSSTSASGVSIVGNVITITEEGSYLVDGTLENGQIVIEVDETEKVQLSLNGVSITNDTTAPIYAVEADKVFITTESGTTNTLTAKIVEDETAETNVDAVVFAKTDLTLNGQGTLVITGAGANGITSKDDLAITGGTYTIEVDQHGLEANNSIRIADGTFDITSGKDGFHSEHDEDVDKGYIYILDGTITIEAEGDGLDSSSYVEIVDGTFDIITGGGYINAPEKVSTMGGGGGMSMGGGGTQRTEMTGQEAQMGGRSASIPEGDMAITETQMGGQGMGQQSGMMMPEGDMAMAEAQMGGQGMGQQGGMMIPEGDMAMADAQMGGQGMGQQSGMMVPEGDMAMMENTMSAERPEATNGTRGEMQTTVVAEDDTVSTKGIKASVSIVIYGGEFIIDSCDDAIHSNYSTEIMDGTFTIATGDDAIHADVNTTISGGAITITTCYEGLEAHTVVVAGGDIDIYALDDGINAATSDLVTDGTEVSITISGGRLVIDANDEGDGLDANGNIYFTGGDVIISGTPTTTDTSLDYNSTAIVTGGTFLAAGSTSQTRQNFGEDSTQCSILMDLSVVQAGTITLTDSSGDVVVEWTPVKTYQSVHISTPDIEVGETYTLTTPTESITFTMDSMLYGEGGNHGSTGGGMKPGR